jgi:hypothetical protein
MKRRPPRNQEPTHVGALLGGSRALAAAGRIDRDRWFRTVGERVANRTRPGHLRDGVLTVYVASAVWAQELSLLSPTILERLRGSGLDVRNLRFRVGEIEPLQQARTVTTERRGAADLPSDLSERLAKIGDPELRAKMAEAAAYSLGKPSNQPISKQRAPRAPRSAERESDPTARTKTPRPGARKGTA